jgi:O-methyltransferase involved in polyketide biosynthesis
LFEDSPVLNRGIDALALRTRFIDDWLLQLLPEATVVDKTNYKNNVIVNLGAGMDARPYRLTELATLYKYIEVDSDRSLLEMKHSILQGGDDYNIPLNNDKISSNNNINGHIQPYCPVTRVEADLSDPKATLNALKDAGLQLGSYEEEISNNNNDIAQEKESIDFIAEGLFAYLQPSQHQPLLKLCHDVSGPNSRLILTCLDPSGIDNFQSMGSFQIPWKKLVPYQNIVSQAQDVGWQHTHVWPMKDLFERYQRRPVTNLDGYFILTLAK